MKKDNLKTATFGAGCFWGVEDTFLKVPGVEETAVGFMGGNVSNPSYEDVSSGKTNHAEVTQVKYDPQEVSYRELLRFFWEMHDPTTLNRQGPDTGSQYRSVIFFHDSDQEKEAKTSKDNLEKSGKLENPIVTEIVSAGEFYQAEEYHQKYFQKQGGGSCHV